MTGIMRQPDDQATSSAAARIPGARAPACPFCGAADAELLSLFGSQLLTEQYYCRTCHTPFEYVKDDPAADMDPR